jgi:A/G-specific adenine glycosylase
MTEGSRGALCRRGSFVRTVETRERLVVTKAQRALLSFYGRRRRQLPWRRTRDPYAIWISEVMLQQTQVATVVPRFTAFLQRFPDVFSLARAKEESVCEAWAGLGYYRRARNLHRAATIVAWELAGQLPVNEPALKQLPGIGDYTAAAIASIAFGERAAAVDGNVVRVLARVFGLPGRASDRELVRAVRVKAKALVDCASPGEINQAVMDLGATLCRPESADCGHCPLHTLCIARGEGEATAYPGKKAKAPRKLLRIAFAFVERGGALLLEQRPLDGLWAGLWELPSASGPRASRDLGIRLGQVLGPRLARICHDLTHRRVVASVYQVTQATAGKTARQKWWRDPLAAPLSSLARKAILAVRGRSNDRHPWKPSRPSTSRFVSHAEHRTR